MSVSDEMKMRIINGRDGDDVDDDDNERDVYNVCVSMRAWCASATENPCV